MTKPCRNKMCRAAKNNNHPDALKAGKRTNRGLMWLLHILETRRAALRRKM